MSKPRSTVFTAVSGSRDRNDAPRNTMPYPDPTRDCIITSLKHARKGQRFQKGCKRKVESRCEEHGEYPAKRTRSEILDIYCERDMFSMYVVDDVFLYLMSFFVSESGAVDRESLQSIMCVSKSWYNRSSTRVLWSLAAAHVSDSFTPNNRKYKSPCGFYYLCPTRPSYQIHELSRRQTIKEEPSSMDDASGKPMPSLIGFARVEKLDVKTSGTYYKVRERATGRHFVVHIPPDTEKNSFMLREISSSHCNAGDSFLTWDDCGIVPCGNACLPTGMDIINGRLLRWYSIPDQKLQQWYSNYRTQRLPTTPPSICQLKRLENCSQLSSDRRHVRVDQWASLVDWIAEIVDVFDLNVSTVFRAMACFDLFISSSKVRDVCGLSKGELSRALIMSSSIIELFCITLKKIQSRKYQLVAATCLLIASKCEDCMICENDLSFCADITFGGENVLEAEEIVLRVIRWQLFLPGIFDFAVAYMKVLNVGDNSKAKWMIQYLSERALQCAVYLNFRPSLIASCVVSLAFQSLEMPTIWPEELEKASGYSWGDLKSCMLALSSDLEHISLTMPALKMISRRYKKAEREFVGMTTIPRITIFPLAPVAQRNG